MFVFFIVYNKLRFKRHSCFRHSINQHRLPNTSWKREGVCAQGNESSTWWPPSLHRRGGSCWFADYGGSEKFHLALHGQRKSLSLNVPAMKTPPPTGRNVHLHGQLPIYRCRFGKQQAALIHRLWMTPRLGGTRRSSMYMFCIIWMILFINILQFPIHKLSVQSNRFSVKSKNSTSKTLTLTETSSKLPHLWFKRTFWILKMNRKNKWIQHQQQPPKPIQYCPNRIWLSCHQYKILAKNLCNSGWKQVLWNSMRWNLSG